MSKERFDSSDQALEAILRDLEQKDLELLETPRPGVGRYRSHARHRRGHLRNCGPASRLKPF